VDAFPWQSGVYFGTIGPYHIFDFHARYQLIDKVAVLMSVSNLFNDRHIEIQGGPAIGRLVMLRLQAEL
jgi:outer membrane receptor protein involved in Fe transport